MKKNYLSRLVHRSGLRVSGPTKVGLLVGAAIVVAGGAVGAVAGTSTSRYAVSPPAPPPAPAQAKLAKVPGVTAPRAVAPVRAAASVTVADGACTSGTTHPASCTYDLWAVPGSVSVPGYLGGPAACPTCVPTWAFTLGTATAAGPAPTTLPGIAPLTAVEGQTLTLQLHNQLAATSGPVSLEVTAQSVLSPDIDGIAPGGSKPYTLNGLAPGTYVVEAGATHNGQRQQAMGLTAMLIVRPRNWTPTCHNAYDETAVGLCNGTPFTAESPLQYSELSTAFNSDPMNSDLAQFKPDVFMVNGRSFDAANPTAGSIAVSPGDKLLLRHANLGIRERSISIGNARMQQLASDSSILSVQPDVAALYINPVQTSDTLTTIDPTLPLNTLLPVYDQGHHLPYWSGGVPTEGGGIGGMIAMINVATGLSGTTAGPRTTVLVGCGAAPPPAPCVDDLNLAPSANDQLTVAATVTPRNGAITAAEWFLDGLGPNCPTLPPNAGPRSTLDPGCGTPIPVPSPTACPAWAPAAANLCFVIDVPTLENLLAFSPPVDGTHTLWVHAQDSNGWGVLGGHFFDVNFSGSLVTDVSLHSTPTNGNRANDIDGSSNFDIIGRATTALSGWVVTAAEVCIAPTASNACASYQSNPAYDQGTAFFGPFQNGQQLNLVSTNTTQYVSSASTTYSASGATDGSALMQPNGYVGDTITAGTSPGPVSTGTIQSNDASTVTLTAPWTGGQPASGTTFTITGPLGTNDPAGPMVGINGAVPASQLLALSDGAYSLYIHACEAPTVPTGTVTPQNCGRWNDVSPLLTNADGTPRPLVIDKTGPTVSSLVVVPDPNNGFQSGPGNTAYLNQVRVTATFNDPVAGGVNSRIALAEVFVSQPGVLPECFVGANSPPRTTTSTPPCPAQATIDGTGAEMVPVGAKWNVSTTQTADAFIPLPDIRAFPEGHVWFWVHAMDQAGNWQPMTLADASAHYQLTLDKTPPLVDSVTATKGATTTALTIHAHDPINSTPQNVIQTNIVRAEWFAAPCVASADAGCLNDPGPGNATAIPVPTPATTVTLNVTIPNQAAGKAVYVRVMDAAGNWSFVDYKHPVVTYP